MKGEPVRLCRINDIPDGGSKSLGDDTADSCFAVRHGEQVFVYRNRCPHAGMPLNWMPDRFLTRDKDLIICAAHGALFNITTGHCELGPCAGAALEKIPVTVKDGSVWKD